MKLSRKKKGDPIYIVPTRYGFLYGALVLLFLVTGTLFESSAFLFATATLVTFGLVCMHQTHLNVSQVSIRKLELESGFSGQTVRWKLRMENKAPITSFSINVRDAVIDVPSGDTFIENIPVKLRERGEVHLKELKIASTYPFGLFYAWKWWEGEGLFYVYPKLISNARVPTPAAQRQTEALGKEDFVGHRDYVVGDSARHIDWKVQARKQKTMVKVFDTIEPEAVQLDWHSALGNTREERLSFLASAVNECYKLQKPFKLTLPDQIFGPSFARLHYRDCLRALALFKGEDEKSA